MHTSVAPALSLAVLSLSSSAALVNQPASAAYAPPAKTEQLVAAKAPAVAPIARRVDMKVAQLVAMPDAARAHTAIIEVDRARVEALANSGGGILSDFPLGNTQTVSLALTPVQPFESDAIIEAMKRDENGHMVAQRLTPNGAFLAGTVLGAEDSHAFLAVSDAGTFGYVELDNHTFIISSGTYGKRQPTVSYDLTALPDGLIETPPWICETAEPAVPPTSGAEGGIAGTTPCRQVRIAYETDYEFLQLFGANPSAGMGYVATLASSLTAIYSRDVNARLSASYLRLWIDASDPWSAGSTSAELNEFKGHWDQFMMTVPRDLAHFLSGRGLGGGIAYLPGLCTGAQYGVSANLAGFFPSPLLDNNGQNWDIYVIAHELGHNFGAPHTHSYSPPLDGCGSSPADCSAADQDIGTIMSYCHLCSGGVANIKLRFHPGNISSIENHLAASTCGYTGPQRAPVVVADSGATFSNVPITFDVLANELQFNCESLIIELFQNPSPNGAQITRSVGTGPDGRDQLTYVMPSDSYSGTDTFTYRVKDPTMQWSIGSVSVVVTALRTPENPAGATAQLDAAYYVLNNPSVLPNFSTLTPSSTGVADSINYASSAGNFAGSGLSNNLGAVFTGWLDVPVSGQWTLFTNSDEGSKLYIGNTLVVNNDGLHTMLEKSGTIGLGVGRHALRVEFFERTNNAGLIVSWQGPGTVKAVIPAANFLRGGINSPADYNNDGLINGADLAPLLNAWGTTSATHELSGDTIISGADLTIMLNGWTG